MKHVLGVAIVLMAMVCFGVASAATDVEGTITKTLCFVAPSGETISLTPGQETSKLATTPMSVGSNAGWTVSLAANNGGFMKTSGGSGVALTNPHKVLIDAHTTKVDCSSITNPVDSGSAQAPTSIAVTYYQTTAWTDAPGVYKITLTFTAANP